MENTKKVVKEPQVKAVETPTIVTTQWEMKDRVYMLKGSKQPPVLRIGSRHTQRKPLLYFDEGTGFQRELRYATNQNSPFVDEQKGVATLGHLVFKNGSLTVPKQKQNLQKLLSLYHPSLNKTYYEYQPEIKAGYEVDKIELELEAMTLAKKLSVDELEAILRVEIGSSVSKMSTKEIKRDSLIFARRSPIAFKELANDDNVHLRNIGIKAVEAGIINLSPDNRKFIWTSSDRKLFTVPFEEHPYSALAAWFKTDEGLEVLKVLEKKIK